MPDETCVQCRGPLPEDGPSPDFCDEICARHWDRDRLNPIPRRDVAYRFVDGVTGTFMVVPLPLQDSLAALTGWTVTATRIEDGAITGAQIREGAFDIADSATLTLYSTTPEMW